MSLVILLKPVFAEAEANSPPEFRFTKNPAHPTQIFFRKLGETKIDGRSYIQAKLYELKSENDAKGFYETDEIQNISVSDWNQFYRTPQVVVPPNTTKIIVRNPFHPNQEGEVFSSDGTVCEIEIDPHQGSLIASHAKDSNAILKAAASSIRTPPTPTSLPSSQTARSTTQPVSPSKVQNFNKAYVQDSKKEAEAARINRELGQDLHWMTKILHDYYVKNPATLKLIEKGIEGTGSKKVKKAQLGAMQFLLRSISKEERFRKNPERASRLLVAMTLFGEARSKSDSRPERTLSYLYYVYHGTMLNRLRHPPKDPDLREELSTVAIQFDPAHTNTAFLNGTAGAVALASKGIASRQYSTWMLGNPSLSEILTFHGLGVTQSDLSAKDGGKRLESKVSTNLSELSERGISVDSLVQSRHSKRPVDDPAIYVDVVDFIAKHDAGLIKTQPPPPEPEINLYSSPISLLNYDTTDGVNHPRNWTPKPGRNQVEGFYHVTDYPRVVNLSQPDRNGLATSAPGTDEGSVNLKYFVGAREHWE